MIEQKQRQREGGRAAREEGRGTKGVGWQRLTDRRRYCQCRSIPRPTWLVTPFATPSTSSPKDLRDTATCKRWIRLRKGRWTRSTRSWGEIRLAVRAALLACFVEQLEKKRKEIEKKERQGVKLSPRDDRKREVARREKINRVLNWEENQLFRWSRWSMTLEGKRRVVYVLVSRSNRIVRTWRTFVRSIAPFGDDRCYESRSPIDRVGRRRRRGMGDSCQWGWRTRGTMTVHADVNLRDDRVVNVFLGSLGNFVSHSRRVYSSNEDTLVAPCAFSSMILEKVQRRQWRWL